MSVESALYDGLGGQQVFGGDAAPSILRDLTFAPARTRRPSCIVRPQTFAQVRAMMKVLADYDSPVSVIGGGHGPRGVVDNAPCLDLRSIPPEVTVEGTSVTINGSARVSDLLSPDSTRVVPVGVAKTPGVGLLTTGGVGGLTRSLGLSIDSIEELTVINQRGSSVRVHPEGDGDLWWAARGAASALGVVESVTFRTHPLERLRETRTLTTAPVLPRWLESALSSPRSTSLSWIMAPGESSADAYVYLVEVSTSAARARSLDLVDRRDALLQETVEHPYREFMDFSVPRIVDAAEPRGPQWATRALWIRGEELVNVLESLVAAVAAAPTKWCRVDFQHLDPTAA